MPVAERSVVSYFVTGEGDTRGREAIQAAGALCVQ